MARGTAVPERCALTSEAACSAIDPIRFRDEKARLGQTTTSEASALLASPEYSAASWRDPSLDEIKCFDGGGDGVESSL